MNDAQVRAVPNMNGCKVEGCHRFAAPKRKGWCEAHYKRWWRYGDPIAGGTFKGEPTRYLNDVVLQHRSDQCLIWPYTRNNHGYAQVFADGGMRLVSRIVCEEDNGPPPDLDSEAAHSCGRGMDGCVARNHVSWRTHTQNMADRNGHGTHNRGERNGQAKITAAVAGEIISLKGNMSQRKIAAMFGVSCSTVGRIHSGSSWSVGDE